MLVANPRNEILCNKYIMFRHLVFNEEGEVVLQIHEKIPQKHAKKKLKYKRRESMMDA